MELVYTSKLRRIWTLDSNHELLWEHGGHFDSKAWHIEKWDDEDMFEKRWGFSSKVEALKFWNERLALK